MASCKARAWRWAFQGGSLAPHTLPPHPPFFPLEVPGWRAVPTAFSVVLFLFYKPGEPVPEIPWSGICRCQPVISVPIYCVSSFDNPCHMWLRFPPFPEHLAVIGLINSTSVRWFAGNVLSPSTCVAKVVLNFSARGNQALSARPLAVEANAPGRQAQAPEGWAPATRPQEVKWNFSFLPGLGQEQCVFLRMNSSGSREWSSVSYQGTFSGPLFHTLSL